MPLDRSPGRRRSPGTISQNTCHKQLELFLEGRRVNGHKSCSVPPGCFSAGGLMKRLLLLLILINIPILNAGAEDLGVLGTVLVEESHIQPPLDYPSAFSTTIDLDKFQGEYNTAAELLSFSPGVVVRDFGGFGQLKTVSIRGSSSNQVVVLLDGLKLNNPLTGSVDLSTIPIQYVESIEVVRGGGSALVGSDALGGVVNIRTRPVSEPLTIGSVTYGSFNTLSLNLSTARQKGDLGYFVSYNHSRSDGDFEYESVNGKKLERINNEFSSHSLLLKLDYDLGDTDISFLNEFYYDDKGVPGLGEFQEDSSNQKDLRNLTSLRIRSSGFLSNDTDITTTLYHKYDKLEFSDPEPQVGIPVNTNSRLSTIGLTNELKWYMSENQVITFSAELVHENLRDEDFNDPSRTNLGLFVGDELTFFDDKLKINPLFRFDLYRTENSGDEYDTGYSPKLGIIYSPLSTLLLKGNISYSHRIPNFSELYFPEQRFIGGNPDLDNEKSLDFDLGFSYALSNLLFEINYFHSRIQDSILFVFVSSQRIEPRNVGDVTQQGIETSIIYKPVEFLDIFAAYTFLDGEIEDTGAQLPGRPKNKFDLRAVFKYSYIDLFWETHFVDNIPLSPFRDSRTTDSRTVHDTGAKINWDKYFLTFEIKNIFDNLDVRDSYDFPLPGRSIYFTAGINY